MTGYRKMISDRIPATWDMALRWNQCRQAWIEYCYNTYLRPLNTNVMKSRKWNEAEKAKRVTEICNVKKGFANSINLDRLLQENSEQYTYWKKIIDWVKWFCEKMPHISNSAKNSYNIEGLRKNALAESISKQYSINVDLSIFILKRLELWT